MTSRRTHPIQSQAAAAPAAAAALRRRPRGRPRHDARDRPTADGILDSAERVFAEHGFCNTSLRDLIVASRMSTTAFYARFESKDDVLAALLMRLMTSLGEAFLATMTHAANVRDGVDAGIDHIVDALARHRTVARVALGEGAAAAPVRTALLDGYRHLCDLVATNLNPFTAGDDDDDAVAWALVGALQMQVLRWAVFDELDERGLRRSLRGTIRTLFPA